VRNRIMLINGWTEAPGQEFSSRILGRPVNPEDEPAETMSLAAGDQPILPFNRVPEATTQTFRGHLDLESTIRATTR
jgi:hypothetical protein